MFVLIRQNSPGINVDVLVVNIENTDVSYRDLITSHVGVFTIRLDISLYNSLVYVCLSIEL